MRHKGAMMLTAVSQVLLSVLLTWAASSRGRMFQGVGIADANLLRQLCCKAALLPRFSAQLSGLTTCAISLPPHPCS